MAGIGGNPVNTAAQAATNYASGAGNALQAQGDARASGVLGQNSAWQNAIGYGVSGALDAWQRYRSATPSFSPYGPYQTGYQMPPTYSSVGPYRTGYQLPVNSGITGGIVGRYTGRG